MDKLKRLITPVTAAFMALCLPLLAHASDNSITIIPAEGNVQCTDYAINSIESMEETNVPGELTGPDVDGDGIDEYGSYEITENGTTFNFTETSVPIDYLVLKSKRTVSVFFYPSGGIYEDHNAIVTVYGDTVALPISAFSLCYGLNNEVAPPPPENLPPVLDQIGDKDVTDGDDLMFTVTASDDIDLVDDTVTITASNVPTGATFTDNGGGSGDFKWLGATPTGSTNVTFVASDGAFIDTETITITVNEIPPEPLVTPTCNFDGTLDEISLTCPDPEYDADGNVTNSSVVCNMELDNVDKDYYGTIDGSDICCICNSDSLEKCDPGIPAGEVNADNEKSCNLTPEEKALRDLPAAEVTTIIEFNNDPYYCYTIGGSRTCFRY